MISHILCDRADEFADIVETASTDLLVRQLPEPPLDHIQPRTGSRDEMKLKTRMSFQPGFDARVLVSPVIVHDEMQVEVLWRLSVNFLKKANELLMSMAGHTVTDNFSIKHVQCCKQGGRTISFVVVRHGSTATLLHRQTWLCAIESLNLAFLIDRENQRSVGGIEVESDNIIKLLDELLVAADLEGTDKMGFEAVLFPDAADRGLTDSLCLCHETRAPMSRIYRLGMQSGFNNRTDFALRDTGDTAGARSILLKPSHSQGKKPLSPQLDSRSRNIQLPRDILIHNAVSSHRNDSCALHEANR